MQCGGRAGDEGLKLDNLMRNPFNLEPWTLWIIIMILEYMILPELLTLTMVRYVWLFAIARKALSVSSRFSRTLKTKIVPTNGMKTPTSTGRPRGAHDKYQVWNKIKLEVGTRSDPGNSAHLII